jgi:diguanylate cyclase (GGDEF)-like protein
METDPTPILIVSASSDPREVAILFRATEAGALAILPLFESGSAIGIFALYADEADVFDEEELTVLTEVADDISFALDHLKKEETINYLAYFDEITGLPNRALFEDRLQQWVGTFRKENKAFSVIILDLERFSIINETLGRRRGDELLRQVARRLQERLDTTDLLARLTADQFGIAIRRGEGADLVHILEGILSDIRNQSFRIDSEELRIAARAGVATFPGDGEDSESLYHNAEAARKSAKFAGEEFRFYLSEMNARVAEKLSFENRLRWALEQHQLVLYYQPKVDFVTRRICGLEALMRWQDPGQGLISPGLFIPILEETGLILEAGRWALERAMTDYRGWREIGLNPPRIAVNVSPIQLRRPDFVAMVEAVQTGVGEAAALELEITESLIMQDIEANIAKLKAVQALGVEVAIDDFGTGYSSLSYIAKLPVNALKIDRAFIVNVAENPDDLAIVSAIISLAHSLNLRVVAEGVETEQQANLLRLLKCNEFQGYLFCPPVPAERIEELLRKG